MSLDDMPKIVYLVAHQEILVLLFHITYIRVSSRVKPGVSRGERRGKSIGNMDQGLFYSAPEFTKVAFMNGPPVLCSLQIQQVCIRNLPT